MTRSASLIRCAVLLGLAAGLASCGGGGGDTPPAGLTTTLSVSVSDLVLAAQAPTAKPAPIPGTARVITVTNTGVHSALLVAASPTSALPAGTTLVGHCATLAPAASCQFTVTPGVVATTAPISLSVQGMNTNTLTPTVQVLTYGSTYQGGYVFALDDGTPNTGSVGGKVVGLVDAAAAVPWSPANDVTGLDELATTPCVGRSDGACNTQAQLARYPANPTTYAAGVCAASGAAGYTDWYLPAACEMGYGTATGCGSAAAPALQNVQTSVVEQAGNTSFAPNFYWTSTELAALPFAAAWSQEIPSAGGVTHNPADKTVANLPARCVRVLTH